MSVSMNAALIQPTVVHPTKVTRCAGCIKKHYKCVRTELDEACQKCAQKGLKCSLLNANKRELKNVTLLTDKSVKSDDSNHSNSSIDDIETPGGSDEGRTSPDAKKRRHEPENDEIKKLRSLINTQFKTPNFDQLSGSPAEQLATATPSDSDSDEQPATVPAAAAASSSQQPATTLPVVATVVEKPRVEVQFPIPCPVSVFYGLEPLLDEAEMKDMNEYFSWLQNTPISSMIRI